MNIYDEAGMVTDDVVKAVDDVIRYVGKDITYGMTLGLGKPVLFINELYRRAKEDPSIKLKILTALSLELPVGRSELEKRLVGPLSERIFGGYPEFDYMADIRDGKMPPNIELFEFYSKAGSIMNRDECQQNHIPSHYTHVAKLCVYIHKVNVFGELISTKMINGRRMYSMGCNTDICVEALDLLNREKAAGRKLAVVGEVNENLPFMYGDAVCESEKFDILLSGPQYNYRLFAPPKDAVSNRDHMIGLNVSALVRDGGTLQIGIGSLGDAIVNSLEMRHLNNSLYNSIIEKAGLLERYGDLIKQIGGTEKFTEGLYSSAEMFVDPFLQLYRQGILKRKVYDNLQIMELVEEKKLSADRIPSGILEMLDQKDAIRLNLREKDFKLLTEYGILKDGLVFNEGYICDGDKKYNADLTDKKNLEQIKSLLGKELKNGHIIQAGFYLGPESFYKALNEMPEEERSQFRMAGVEKVNQLYGDEKLRTIQRKKGRFVNTGMMATLTGAIISDQLEDGRVVSGIGGQYNFVSMAHLLPDGKLIMTIRSTRGTGKNVKSNIVFNYGHCTIPKHMRDIIVTEYGIAHIKGLPERQIIEEMIKITDSRFQQQLVDRAKKAGKLRKDYQVPAEYRNNFPEKIDALIKTYQPQGYFKQFPYGTDISPEEIVLGGSLKMLKVLKEQKPLSTAGRFIAEMLKPVPEKAVPYLERMKLNNPVSINEKLQQKLVLLALRNSGRI